MKRLLLYALLCVLPLGGSTLWAQHHRGVKIDFGGYVQTLWQIGNQYDAFTVGKNVGRYDGKPASRFGIRRGYFSAQGSYRDIAATITVDVGDYGVKAHEASITYTPGCSGFFLKAGLQGVRFGNELSLKSSALETFDRPAFLDAMIPGAIDWGATIGYNTPATSRTRGEVSVSVLSGNGANKMDKSLPNFSANTTVKHRMGGSELALGLSAYIGSVEKGEQLFARRYYGAHAALSSRYDGGVFDLRTEVAFGKQPGTLLAPYVFASKADEIDRGDVLVRPFVGATLFLGNRFAHTPLRLFARYTFTEQNRNLKERYLQNQTYPYNFALEGMKHTATAGTEFYFLRDKLKLTVAYQFNSTQEGFNASQLPTFDAGTHLGLVGLQYAF